jgi:hypothetical protein
LPGRRADASSPRPVGSSGQAAARITLQLLGAGYKVVAGAPDAAAAQAALEFAKKYEVVSKEQVGRGRGRAALPVLLQRAARAALHIACQPAPLDAA